jgi:hypothetical protein
LPHKFSVGQTVTLAHRMLQNAPAGPYEIAGLRPSPDNAADEPRYRIKSVDEKHERIAIESDLTLAHQAPPV